MIKRAVVLGVFCALFLLSIVSAGTVNENLARTTYYAKQYEIGNINYAQLIIFLDGVEKDLNQILAVSSSEQLIQILGKESKTTNWIWIKSLGYEKQVESSVPIWENLIIFDGQKTIIKINVFPILITENSQIKYTADVKIEFQKPKSTTQVNQEKSTIKDLASTFSKSTKINDADSLAVTSNKLENTISNQIAGSTGTCELALSNFINPEFKIGERRILVTDNVIYQDKKNGFEAIVRIKECETCEEKIDLSIILKVDGREYTEQIAQPTSPALFNGFNAPELKKEFIGSFKNAQTSASKENYGDFFRAADRSETIHGVWINNIKKSESGSDAGTPDQQSTEQITGGAIMGDSLTGIVEPGTEETTPKEPVKEFIPTSYEEMREFYYGLLTNAIEERNYFFTESIFQAPYFQEIKPEKQEGCSNGIDDDKDKLIDCEDLQCAGQTCAENKYCIEKICKEKIIPIQETTTIKCGNHICESGEQTSCLQDCIVCPEYPALTCSGEVIFSGEDENGCPLKPTCIEKPVTCQTNAECEQPLCGVSECIENECRLTELDECKTAQCTEGEEKTQKCSSGEEIILEKCISGVWKKLGQACAVAISEMKPKSVTAEIIIPETTTPTQPTVGTAFGNTCIKKEDCGRETDVCRNGVCVTLPQNSVTEATTTTVVLTKQLQQIETSAVAKQAIITKTIANIESVSTTEKSSSLLTGQITLTGISRQPEGIIYDSQNKINYVADNSEENSFGACAVCRNSPLTTGKAIVSFDGVGEFDKVDAIKTQVYINGNPELCKEELTNLLQQRKELKESFEKESFCSWFFEERLANSVEDWERNAEGIKEMYNKIIENQKQIAYKMDCLGIEEFDEYGPINVNCNTQYGRLILNEEGTYVQFSGMASAAKILSLNMRLWVFPSEKSFEYGLRQSMVRKELPSALGKRDEREAEGGLTSEEKAIIKKDDEFMNEVRKIALKYGGNVRMLVQFKDKNDEIAYNFYATIDEKNILKVDPLPIDESPTKVNIVIKVDFEKLYDLLYTIEKNLIGNEIESPSWNEKRNLFSVIQGTINKMGVSIKINNLIDSLEVSPTQSEADAKNIFKKFVLRIIATEYDDKEMIISDIEKSLWD